MSVQSQLNCSLDLKEGDERKAAEILTLDGELTGEPTITVKDLGRRLRERYYGNFCVRVARIAEERSRFDLAIVAYQVAAEKYYKEGRFDISESIRTALAKLVDVLDYVSSGDVEIH